MSLDFTPENPLYVLVNVYVRRSGEFAAQQQWGIASIWLERAVTYAPESAGLSLLAGVYCEHDSRFAQALCYAADALILGAEGADAVSALMVIERCSRQLGDEAGCATALMHLNHLRGID